MTFLESGTLSRLVAPTIIRIAIDTRGGYCY